MSKVPRPRVRRTISCIDFFIFFASPVSYFGCYSLFCPTFLYFLLVISSFIRLFHASNVFCRGHFQCLRLQVFTLLYIRANGSVNALIHIPSVIHPTLRTSVLAWVFLCMDCLHSKLLPEFYHRGFGAGGYGCTNSKMY